jgi:hypothetical protein
VCVCVTMCVTVCVCVFVWPCESQDLRIVLVVDAPKLGALCVVARELIQRCLWLVFSMLGSIFWSIGHGRAISWVARCI